MRKAADISEKILTDAQNAAIYTVDRSVSVVAGAGSGKTTVLIDRTLHIMGDDLKELDRLLAITFTEKAAGELKKRLRKKIPQKEHFRLERAWIGTFHACFARMLKQHAPVLGLDPSFDILDENAAKLLTIKNARTTLLDMLAEKDEDAVSLVDALEFKTALGALEDLLSFRWHAKKMLLIESKEQNAEAKIISHLSKVFLKADGNLADHFLRYNILDFQELESKALELLISNPDILDSYRKRFKHILVDEFQDTNDAQTELVLKLFDPKKNFLCIVGDPRQSIYRFRGANVDCFSFALDKIKKLKGETIHLAENFRSHPEIVDFVNICQQKLSDGLFGKLSEEGMIAARKDYLKSRAVVALNIKFTPDSDANQKRGLEGDEIASFISKRVSSGEANFGDFVCLFQALTSSFPYEAAFRRAGIPFRFFGGRGLLERQEITDLLSVISFAASPSDDVALLTLLRSPLIGLSDDDLIVLAKDKNSDLLSSARNDPRCRLLNELESMAKHLRPSEILKRVLDITGYELICHKLDPSGWMCANISRLISIAATIEREEPLVLADFSNFMRELKNQGARLGDPPAAADITNAVRCMTVHAAKGLEFPIVILPDLFRIQTSNHGNWIFSRKEGVAFKLKDPANPFGKRIESERYTQIKEIEKTQEEAELKRLLYVAMTRAKDTLVLPIHAEIKRTGKWHEWLEGIVEKQKQEITEGLGSIVIPAKAGIHCDLDKSWIPAFAGMTSKAYETSGTNDDLTISRSHDLTISRFSVSQLECYTRCPVEYHLKYILKLPAREILKSSEDKLPANIFGSIVHGVLAKYNPSENNHLDALIESECISCGVIPENTSTKRIRIAIEDALKIPINTELKSGEREVNFNWKIFNNLVVGSIDWLIPRGKNFEVADFKTDRIEAGDVKRAAAGYELQLACYALAFEAATKGKIESTSLIFLTPKAVHREIFTEERRKNALSSIEDIFAKISKRNFNITSEPPCIRCPYHHNKMCSKDLLVRS